MNAVVQHRLEQLYEREGGKLVHDERAHVRINKLEEKLSKHDHVLYKMDANLEKQTECLKTISTNLAPVTNTIKVIGWTRTAIKWISPVILLGIAIWGAYYQYSHSHL